MLISPGFFRDFVNARQVYVMGNKGTGKTLFSVALGYHLLSNSWVSSVVSNFPCSLSSAVIPPLSSCYLVLDEVGQYLDSRLSYRSKELTLLLAGATVNLRKTGNYLALPTFIEGDSRMRAGSIRVFRRRAVGSFLWLYQCDYGTEDTQDRRPGVNWFSYPLLLFFPSRYFALYDTSFVASGSLPYDLMQAVSAVGSPHR